MKKIVVFACLAFIGTAFATDELKIIGTEKITLTPKTASAPEETVGVMKFSIPERVKARLANRVVQIKLKPNAQHDDDLPSSVDLGMNNTPVLNQGHHGSCVTFANTGALDAALGKGDYISQLCNLALGKSFAENGFQFSGWSGSFGPLVLSQITNFGIMNTADQEKYGCGGLYEYPMIESSNTVKPMPLTQFHRHNENIGKNIVWTELITAYDWLEGEYCPCKFLHDVKLALSEEHRVTFGTLLDVKVGHAGALGHYKSTTHNDTWMLTPVIEEHAKQGVVDAGHELVIYGYDDNASINGQQGILFIRNSWGERAGFNGDYFMTYDYFKLLAYEGQKIMVVDGKMPPPGK